MQLNVAMLATFPYIVVGERTDFSDFAGRIQFGFFLIAQAAAISVGPVLAYTHPSHSFVLMIFGAADVILVIIGIVVYHITLWDRIKKRKCTVLDAIISDFRPMLKETGYVRPHQINAVFAATNEHNPSHEEFVQKVTDAGCHVLMLENEKDRSHHSAYQTMFALMKENIDRKFSRWTSGVLVDRYHKDKIFFVFEDKNDATEFRLTCT